MLAIPKSITSPLTSRADVKHLRSIPRDVLIQKYQADYQIDVSSHFAGLKNIELYECNQTGYRFYYPLHIAGDSHFYEQLQGFEWYYMPWKWEHQTVYEQIEPQDKVLEIGCAQGAFLEKLTWKGVKTTGLELNQKALTEAQARKLPVLGESIQEHALRNPETYDVVCSFQVMEHIPMIGEVLKASCDCLKPGGRLYISVPNNGSFLGLDEWNTLNLPPHHMGLWDQASLEKLEEVLPIKTHKFYLEPPQEYHRDFFKYITEKKMKDQHKEWVQAYGLIGKIIFRLRKGKYLRDLYKLYPQLHLYTIIAEYHR